MNIVDPNVRFPNEPFEFKRKLAELFRIIAQRVNKTEQGVWTPTTTNDTNVTSSSADECFWVRTLDVVQFYGTCTIDPTAGSAQTIIDLSLPVASNFSNIRHARGGAVRGGTGVTNISGVVVADTTTDKLQLSFFCDADAASRGWSFWGAYRVI